MKNPMLIVFFLLSVPLEYSELRSLAFFKFISLVVASGRLFFTSGYSGFVTAFYTPLANDV